MSQRHKRNNTPPRPHLVLAGLKVCRDAMIALHIDLKPAGRAYLAAAGVVTAIDKLAEVLTGDPTHFHAKVTPSVRRGDGAT